LGAKIKWNPAVKTENDRIGLLDAILKNKLDIIATDHAPHAWPEKQGTYVDVMSGGPSIQHSLPIMLELCNQGKITLERIVEKMSHNVARIYKMIDRGFIREGYFADLVLIDLNNSWTANSTNTLYKCKWSPFEGQKFSSSIVKTFVNGHLVYDNGLFDESKKGKRLKFLKLR
jgi:dihydroorotase